MDGGYSGDGKVQHYQARKMKIKTSPKLDVMADGIALGKGTVTIKVRKALCGSLRLRKNRAGNPPKDAAKITLSAPVSPIVEKNHGEEVQFHRNNPGNRELNVRTKR